MKEYRLTDWLPTTKKEIELRGWNELDIILFSADAYVDHPSFGAAVIGRILEAEGLKIAIVPQPNWRDDLRDFKKLGRPRLFFGISGGCMDSMVNKYTANKRLRSEDAYTPDGRPDMRPDYPSTVYSQILKRLYPDVPVILGGIEASMRRLSHYDYWQDKVQKSILCDSGADLLIYGMGEKPIVELTRKIKGLLLMMGMFLAGCGANSGSAGIEEDAVMQELYDRSEIARGYTDPIFQEYLDQYDSDCEIKETSFGFEPAETPAQAQYFVEYQYSNGVSDDLKYFYQVQVDDNHNCIVLKEGEGQAEMETSTEDAEIEWLTQ